MITGGRGDSRGRRRTLGDLATCPISQETAMPSIRAWSLGLVSVVPVMYTGRSQDPSYLNWPCHLCTEQRHEAYKADRAALTVYSEYSDNRACFSEDYIVSE